MGPWISKGFGENYRGSVCVGGKTRLSSPATNLIIITHKLVTYGWNIKKLFADEFVRCENLIEIPFPCASPPQRDSEAGFGFIKQLTRQSKHDWESKQRLSEKDLCVGRRMRDVRSAQQLRESKDIGMRHIWKQLFSSAFPFYSSRRRKHLLGFSFSIFILKQTCACVFERSKVERIALSISSREKLIR